MVRKKGGKASEKMIARVQERDPGLHDKCGLAPFIDICHSNKLVLDLIGISKNLTDTLSQQEEHPVSSVLIPSTKDFKEDILQRKGHEVRALLGCQSKDGSVWVSDVVPGPSSDLGLESDSISREHKNKDLISLLSCTPDNVSYRNKQMCTFFVRCIMETFNTYA
ncbi:unnamed protein product, partial [Coregonus sp. 'balchen']